MDGMLPSSPATGRGRMTSGETPGRVASRRGERAYFSPYLRRWAQYTSTSTRGSMSVWL